MSTGERPAQRITEIFRASIPLQCPQLSTAQTTHVKTLHGSGNGPAKELEGVLLMLTQE